MKKIALPTAAIHEKLSAFTAAQKALLFLGTILVLAGGFYYFIYSDQVDGIAKLNASIADQEKRLVQVKQAAAQVDVLTKELAESEKEVATLVSFLPDQKEIPALLENLSQLGSKVGLENILFQPQAEQLKEFYAIIPIRLDLVGSFQQVATFLDNVSKLHRILKVENLSLARSGNTPTLQVGCTLVTYRFIEAPAASKPK